MGAYEEGPHQGVDLLQATRKVEKIDVKYATVAKKVKPPCTARMIAA